MKKTLVGIVIGVAAILVVFAVVKLKARNSGQLSFEEIIDNVNLMRNTELHAREYWRKCQNQELKSSGIVVDVKPKGRLSEVIVVNKSRTAPGGFNLVLIVPDIARAADLKKKQSIKFKGILNDFKGGEGRGTALYLINAEILP